MKPSWFTTARPPWTLAATGASWSISLYLFVVALVSFVSILLLSETYHTDLTGVRPEERQLIEDR